MAKIINNGVKRAVREHLEIILNEEEKSFERWNDMLSHKQNATRRKQVERAFNKRIQAMRIVIHSFTPFWEREVGEVPTFVLRKQKREAPESFPTIVSPTKKKSK